MVRKGRLENNRRNKNRLYVQEQYMVLLLYTAVQSSIPYTDLQQAPQQHQIKFSVFFSVRQFATQFPGAEYDRSYCSSTAVSPTTAEHIYPCKRDHDYRCCSTIDVGQASGQRIYQNSSRSSSSSVKVVTLLLSDVYLFFIYIIYVVSSQPVRFGGTGAAIWRPPVFL